MAKAKKQETEALIPRGAEVDEFTKAATEDAVAVLEFVGRVAIAKPADREFASNALSEIAAKHDAWEAKRLKWVKPLKAVASDIDASFRPATKALAKAIDELKAKIGAWDVEQAQKRSALLSASAEAARDGNAAAAEKAYEKAAAFVPAEGGAGSKIYWTGEVIDAAAIPREYLTPDLDKLQAVTKAHGADPGIPGWRTFPDAAVRTSRKGAA